MPQVRYLGFSVGEGAFDAARGTDALGRFVGLREPLPVGTTVDIDGEPHRVTRVEEGGSPGIWALTLGARPTRGATPVRIDPETTVPSPPPAEATAAAAETAETAQPAEASASAPPPEEGTPEPVAEGSGPSKGRKRRRGKTVTGR